MTCVMAVSDSNDSHASDCSYCYFFGGHSENLFKNKEVLKKSHLRCSLLFKIV